MEYRADGIGEGELDRKIKGLLEVKKKREKRERWVLPVADEEHRELIRRRWDKKKSENEKGASDASESLAEKSRTMAK